MLPIALANIARLFAYIDPVGGSILLQAILSGAVGAVVYFFRPILRFFGFMKKSSPAEESAEHAADDREVKGNVKGDVEPETPPKA